MNCGFNRADGNGFVMARSRRHLPTERALKGVDGREAFGLDPKVLGQAVVGGAHVGEEGVPTDVGYLQRPQDRRAGRLFTPGHVVVPLVLVSPGVRSLGEPHEVRLRLLGGNERVDLQLSEPPGEAEVLLGCHVLVPEEDHLVGIQGRLDLPDGRLRKGTGQVDSGQHRTHGATQHPGVEVLPREAVEAGAFLGQVGRGAEMDRVVRHPAPPGLQAGARVVNCKDLGFSHFSIVFADSEVCPILERTPIGVAALLESSENDSHHGTG